MSWCHWELSTEREGYILKLAAETENASLPAAASFFFSTILSQVAPWWEETDHRQAQTAAGAALKGEMLMLLPFVVFFLLIAYAFRENLFIKNNKEIIKKRKKRKETLVYMNTTAFWPNPEIFELELLPEYKGKVLCDPNVCGLCLLWDDTSHEIPHFQTLRIHQFHHVRLLTEAFLYFLSSTRMKSCMTRGEKQYIFL